jgi:hypothetical protein
MRRNPATGWPAPSMAVLIALRAGSVIAIMYFLLFGDDLWKWFSKKRAKRYFWFVSVG